MRPLPRADQYRHIRGVHCVTTALRNVVHHHTGTLLTEAMVFGIGAGLNFSYIRDPQSRLCLVLGRGSYVETTFCEALGIELQPVLTDSRQLSWEYIVDHLDRNEIVMVDSDMFALPYVVKAFELPTGVHFGGHKLILVGHDSERGTARVADYAWSELQELPLDVLAFALGNQNCLSAPNNTTMVFDFPEQLLPLDAAIVLGLERMVGQMRSSNTYVGLIALDRFCRQAPKWRALLSEQETILNARLAAFMMEKAGTGGGNYRRLYGNFLTEAAAVCGDDGLAAIAPTYAELGRKWRQMASLLEAASQDLSCGFYDPKERGDALLEEIQTLEHHGVTSLEQHLAHLAQAC